MSDGLLSIKHEEKINKVPVGKVKKIYLTRGVYLSTDVIYTCLDQGIDLILVEKNGKPLGRLWNNKFGSISSIRKNQLDFARGPNVTGWVIQQLTIKIENQIDLLVCLKTLDEPLEALINESTSQMRRIAGKLSIHKQDDLSEVSQRIRALEGQAARIYFTCINKHLPNKYQFDGRSRHPALDMVNAMLNYVYGILYSHLESGLIKAGLDPFIGLFHRDEYNRPVLTYDVIEPFRPWADWVVFHLCLNEILDESHFEIDKGQFWLYGDAKRFLIQHFTDFFDEVIDYNGKRLSRLMHLERSARNLASLIIDESSPSVHRKRANTNISGHGEEE